MAERITLDMNLQQVVMALGEGNPGALTVCCQLLKEGARIDPLAWDPVCNLLDLDTMGIYGSRIWILYKDVCGQKLENMIALFRANQLGQLEGVTDWRIREAIDAKLPMFDFDAIMAAVRREIPDFNRAEANAQQG